MTLRRAGRRRDGPTPVADPDSPDAAYAAAIKRLAHQPETRAGLAQKLARAGYRPAAVDAALDRAQERGYLDDRAYAAAVVRRRALRRGHALIAKELRAKGVEDWAATPALAQIDPEAEYEQALAIGRQLVAGKRPADEDGLLTYVAPRLARRGFSSGIAYRVCRQLAAEFEPARLFDERSEHN